MEAITSTQGRNLQYAVIARLNIEHDAHGLDAYEVMKVIALELMTFIEPSDIIQRAPNFIICFKNPETQELILHQRILRTNYFQLEMLPWCKEHEWAQLPWITAPTSDNSKIIIDPLQILPVAKPKRGHQGIHSKLKDTFASTIPKNYDLRAPDLSYLLITELKEYYKTKSNVFTESRDIIKGINDIFPGIYATADRQLQEITKYVEPPDTGNNFEILHDQRIFITTLKTIIQSTDTTFRELRRVADTVLAYNPTTLNLEGFTIGPPSIEIPVPSTYTNRLKVIYNVVIQRIHGTQPILETVKRAENRYETYVTIGNFTRRYFGPHTRNAEAMEANAIFYALKHITNVRGYRVIDINYPTLEKMVSHIDAWNAQMTDFKIFTNVTLKKLYKLHNDVLDTCTPVNHGKLHVKDFKSLYEATGVLLQTIEQYCARLTNICEQYNATKKRYHSIRIGVYSPTRSAYHWAQAARPSITSSSRD